MRASEKRATIDRIRAFLQSAGAPMRNYEAAGSVTRVDYGWWDELPVSRTNTAVELGDAFTFGQQVSNLETGAIYTLVPNSQRPIPAAVNRAQRRAMGRGRRR